jgi:hypothetical protein
VVEQHATPGMPTPLRTLGGEEGNQTLLGNHSPRLPRRTPAAFGTTT